MKIDNRYRQRASGREHARTGPCMQALIVAAAMVALAPLPATAFEFDTGDGGVKLRWDNTFKYSAAARLRSRDSVLAPGCTPRPRPPTRRAGQATPATGIQCSWSRSILNVTPSSMRI